MSEIEPQPIESGNQEPPAEQEIAENIQTEVAKPVTAPKRKPQEEYLYDDDEDDYEDDEDEDFMGFMMNGGAGAAAGFYGGDEFYPPATWDLIMKNATPKLPMLDQLLHKYQLKNRKFFNH
jgi:hypothetical protein